MAALVATPLTPLLPVGNRFMRSYSVPIANTGAADEWFVAAGISHVESIVGNAPLGTAGLAATLNFVLNANGTGQTAGTTPGSVGIESGTAVTAHITVIGKP